MGTQIQNFYFISRDNIGLIYDFERNRIISYPQEINIENIIEVLLPNTTLRDRNLNTQELKLYNYLKSNIIANSTETYSTFEHFEKKDFEITSVSLMVAQNCNLSCDYCYGGKQGRYGNNGEFLMSEDIAKKAIKKLVQDNRKDSIIVVNFFGGEPLLNFKLIQFVVNHCKKEYPDNIFSFHTTTNGTLINDEIASFLKENEFKILISLDGMEEIHNFHRKTIEGKGSFSNVMNGILKLKEHGVEFSVRSTLNHKFYGRYFEVINFLKSTGAAKVSIARLNNYTDDDLNFPISAEKINTESGQLHHYVEKIEEEILEGKEPDYIPFISYFKKIIMAEQTLSSCGAYAAGTAISTDGTFYPCHRFVGMKGFGFGNVESGVDTKKMKTQLDQLDVKTKACLNCFAKFLCQRACIRDIAKNNGEFIKYDEDYCDVLRENVDKALITYYKILKRRPEFFNIRIKKEESIGGIIV